MLHRMIEQVQSNPPKEVFFRVATEMFADGNFNWGRVVALFYFACKLVLKVSDSCCTNIKYIFMLVEFKLIVCSLSRTLNFNLL